MAPTLQEDEEEDSEKTIGVGRKGGREGARDRQRDRELRDQEISRDAYTNRSKNQEIMMK